MAIATSNSVTIPAVNSGNGTLEDEFINGLVQGGSWVFSGPRDLTYSFNINDDGAGNPGFGGNWTVTFTTAVTQALTAWSNVANINFQQVTSGTYYYQSAADLTFTLTGTELQSTVGAIGLGVFPSPTFADGLFDPAEYPYAEGDVFLDNYSPEFFFVTPGSSGFWVILHEIGHALGLKHSFDDGENGRPTFASLGIGDYDAMRYTLMLSAPLPLPGYAATPMPLDILAIQAIYGANTTYHTGNDTYLLNNGFYGTIWDAGGVDTIDATSWPGTDGVQIDLNAGRHSGIREGEKTTAIAFGTTIENAIGTTGYDWLVGNSSSNVLNGVNGNDTLDGGGGIDTLIGYWGDDFYFVDSPQDRIIDGSNEGYDVVYSSTTYGLSEWLEELHLTGSESVSGTGNSWDNVISGNSGANVIDGGAGFDSMGGGAGDDIYVFDTLQPENLLIINGGVNDYVSQGKSYLITENNVADYRFSSFLQDRTGDGLIDSVIIGVESFVTPLGYLYSPENFSVRFNTYRTGANIVSGTTYSNVKTFDFGPSGYAGLEVGFAGRWGTAVDGEFSVNHIDIDYSGAAPVLKSLSVSFVQISEKLSGFTSLSGVINYQFQGQTGEIVHEELDAGRDAIRSSVNATLPDNVENLILTGTGDLAGSGNTQGNIISGNSGSNLLSGEGGADIIAGGLGDDTYVIDNSGDQVMELGNSGTDLIQSGVAYNLMQAWHVENLTLTGGGAGNGSGNWLNNVLTGNGAANVLDGGLGNDTLNGGDGNDTLLGGLGDDVVVWDAIDGRIDGGAGFDRLVVNGGGTMIDLTAIPDSQITDFECLDITGSGNNTLTLTMSDVLAISSTTDALRVDGEAGDVVNVVNVSSEWIDVGTQVIGGQTYISYTQGLAMLLLDLDISYNFFS